MSAVFTEQELIALDKTQAMRMRLAELIMSKDDDKLPQKPAELMAATNLFESIDRSILGRSKLRIEDSSAKDDAAHKEILRNLMLEMHQNKGVVTLPGAPAPTPLTLSAEAPVYTPSGSTVTPGELILRTDVPELPEHLR